MQQGERVTPRIAPSLLPRPCGACVTSGGPRRGARTEQESLGRGSGAGGCRGRESQPGVTILVSQSSARIYNRGFIVPRLLCAAI